MMNDVSTSHSVAWSLIPWMVNGTICAEDRERLERHLDDCEECHAQFMLECRIRDRMRADIAGDDAADVALARLFERIDADDVASTAPATQPRSTARAPAWNRWLAAVVIVQAIGLAAFAGMHLKLSDKQMPTTSAEYRTLSQRAGTAQTAVIRFVPAPDMTIAAMHTVLAATGLQIVESTPHSAIFGLALAPDSTPEPAGQRIANAVDALSRRPDVLFAEPILSIAQVQDD